MNRGNILHNIEARLRPIVGEFSRIEAETILQSVLKVSRTELLLSPKKELEPDVSAELERIVTRRLKNEPLQYILGSAYFFDRDFTVTPKVLIPRPDTEILVETVLLCHKHEQCRFADMCTGSGIIAAVLKNQRPSWHALGVDISIDALRVAKINSSAINLLCSDMFSAFKKGERFDFFVSNPPYICATEMKSLDKSVLDFEPRKALFGGEDGLDFYRVLASRATDFLIDRGHIHLEIGYNQKEAVQDILHEHGWTDIILRKDLQGHPRVVSARGKTRLS